MLSSASDKGTLFDEVESDITLHAFPSRAILKLHNIPVTTKMVKKFITNLESYKASIPAVVPRNCVPAISYLLIFLICG